MRKALLLGLCFVMVCLMLISSSFALPDLNEVFADLTDTLGGALGLPVQGGAGTPVHVTLLADDTPQRLFPGGSASRIARVRNAGEGSVYFRLVYAVQYDPESWPQLDIRFTAEESYAESGWQDISIGGTPYRMKVFTYTQALVAEADSPGVALTIAMDSSVTSEQISRYRSDFLQTQVLAIDPTPFAEIAPTAVQALDMALPLDSLNPF